MGTCGRYRYLHGRTTSKKTKAIKCACVGSPTLVRIFSDSRSAIEAVNGFQPSNDYIIHIRNIVADALSANIRIELHWIPIHIGIIENDTVDQLANSARSSQCEKITPPPRTSLKPDAWLTHSHHRKNSILHRLRGNRTLLNSRLAKFDPSISPRFTHGCTAVETVEHVIVACHHYQVYRVTIRQHCSKYNITFNLHSLLNPSADDYSTNFATRDAVLEFLWKSGIHK
ncbi:hypothetical protein OUZ56_018696 [Daphnia magna]|uniref:RNase H type-1 domain-containing protein n=1 Tax=Daphnia magna TaxID=35525 RepID=A0ABQ9Z9I1_9CRUS|nr:hypothetical protein OUZ56_018696 [Daphnia magna]